MSTLNVNNITNKNLDGPPVFENGIVVTGDFTGNTMSVTGELTADTFFGDGSNLQNLQVTTTGVLFALKFVIDPLPFYRH